MSSHHVIRDGQEPPVLILDESGARHNLLSDLLEWSPITICYDAAMPVLLQRRIKVDHLICMITEPADWRPVFDTYYQASLHKVSDHDEAMATICELLTACHSDSIHVTGAPESRDLAEKLPGAVYFSENIKWTYHAQGRYSKWLRAGTQLIVDGPYNPPRNYRKAGKPLLISENGKLEITGLNNTWIGECFQI